MELSSKSNWFTFVELTGRNIKIFFKDKASVFFSFLSPLIVLMLYVFFLGDLQVMNVNSVLQSYQLSVDQNTVESFVNAWLIAGVLATSCITIALGSLGVMVEDKNKKITTDFAVSPMKGYVVMFSYFAAGFFVTLLLSMCVFAVGIFYLVVSGGFYMTFLNVLETIGIIVLSCLSATLFVLTILTFVKSNSVFSIVSTIVGTLVGFLTGAYMPLNLFPKGVQYFANFIPGSHSAGLFRNVIMSGPLDKLFIGNEAFKTQLASGFSFELNFFNHAIGTDIMYIILSGSIVLFAAVNLIIYKFKRK